MFFGGYSRCVGVIKVLLGKTYASWFGQAPELRYLNTCRSGDQSNSVVSVERGYLDFHGTTATRDDEPLDLRCARTITLCNKQIAAVSAARCYVCVTPTSGRGVWQTRPGDVLFCNQCCSIPIKTDAYDSPGPPCCHTVHLMGKYCD